MTFKDYMEYAGSMMDQGLVPVLFIRMPTVSQLANQRGGRFREFFISPGYEDKLLIIQCDRILKSGVNWYDVGADSKMYRIYIPHLLGFSFKASFMWPVFSYEDIPDVIRFWRSKEMDEPASELSGKFKDFADRVEISFIADGIILPESRPEKTEKTPRRKIPDIV